MPKIAELREIDGNMWARIVIDSDSGSIMLLSEKEIKENNDKMMRLLDKIDELSEMLGLKQ